MFYRPEILFNNSSEATAPALSLRASNDNLLIT